MTRHTIRRICEEGYMLAVCALLLWDIPYMTEAAWTFQVRRFLPLVGYGLAVGAVVLRGKWRDSVWPVLFLGWLGVSSVLAGGDVLNAQLPALHHGVTAFLAILPAGMVIEKRRMLRWTRRLLAVWTAVMTAQALIGLWAMFTGHAVFSLKGTWYIGLNRGDLRLYLNAYVTTGAVKMGLSVLLAVIGAAMTNRKSVRILYGLCVMAMLACLSLTDCRTAFIATGASLGCMLAVRLLWGKQVDVRWRPRLHWCRAAVSAVAVCVAVYGGLAGLVTLAGPHIPHELDNLTLLELPAHLLPEAGAEAAEVQHRTIEVGNVFNGRAEVWKAALRLLWAEPHLLLTGATAVQAPQLVNAFVAEEIGRTFYHVHSIYLHVLVAWGLPGAGLLGWMLLRFLRSAWRLTVRHAAAGWMKLLPVPVLYVLLCETVDCFTLLSAGSPMLLFGCFFAGWTIQADRQEASKWQEVPTVPIEATLDVIIPAYNAEATLHRAVHSVLDCPRTRAIIVDDGSTDGTAALCDALALSDRVMVLHQENGGASAARNAGLSAATGTHVTFLDADDTLLPGVIGLLFDETCDAAQGRVVRRDTLMCQPPVLQRMTGAAALDAALRNPTVHLHTHGWVFRREVLTERFDPSLTLGEDGEWLMRTLRSVPNAAYTDLPAYLYSLRRDSALHGQRDGVCDAYMKTLTAAAPALAQASPEAAALYRLSHLLLMLTHGHFDEAMRLRETPLFVQAFRQAKLTGMSPRIWTLRFLQWRWTAAVRCVIRVRRWMNKTR